MLAHITDAFSKAGLNILQQINQSQGSIAYNVIDIDCEGHADVLFFKNVQEQITMLEGVLLTTRVLYSGPDSSVAAGYARNMDDAHEYV